MATCKMLTEELSIGQWRHTCQNCGHSEVCAAPVLRQMCPAGKQIAIVRPVAPGLAAQCIHRGEKFLRLQKCTTCQGDVKIKIFPCQLFGECAIEMPVVDHTCLYCSEFQPNKGVIP